MSACMVQRIVVKVWLLSHKRVPTLSNLSPCSWYLTLFEDKQRSKSGGIDIWCFWHLVYMFSNWFSSLYRVFLVLFESLQVWSCIGLEIDQLEQKGQNTMQSGDFHAEQSEWLFPIAEQPEWLFWIERSNPSVCSSGRIFKETTSHYEIFPNYPIFFSQPPVASKKLLFLFFYAIFGRRNQTLELETWVFATL